MANSDHGSGRALARYQSPVLRARPAANLPHARLPQYVEVRSQLPHPVERALTPTEKITRCKIGRFSSS